MQNPQDALTGKNSIRVVSRLLFRSYYIDKLSFIYVHSVYLPLCRFPYIVILKLRFGLLKSRPGVCTQWNYIHLQPALNPLKSSCDAITKSSRMVLMSASSSWCSRSLLISKFHSSSWSLNVYLNVTFVHPSFPVSVDLCMHKLFDCLTKNACQHIFYSITVEHLLGSF